MTLKELVKKELYVATHAQTARFRVLKYIVIFSILGVVYAWGGERVIACMLGVMVIFALAMHFFFRWKTKGWEENWGTYKPPEGLPK